MPRIVFVLSPYQNAFFPELVEALSAALTANGVATVTTTEPHLHPIDDDDVFVLVPAHEFATLEGTAFIDDPVVAARTIGLTAEQPHQSFFRRNAALGARLGAVMDFSPLAVLAYRREGVEAQHLSFGHVPEWDRFDRRSRTGPPVLYLGNKARRRLGQLAEAADDLAAVGARLLISDNSEPNRTTSETFVAGSDKRELLAATGLLVNIHQSEEPYFEWLRFIEAAHCGTPVLSERSVETDPFVAGVHFLDYSDGELGSAMRRAVDDPDGADRIAARAYEQLRAMPLSTSVEALVRVAESRLGAPAPASLPARTRTEPIGRDQRVALPRKRPARMRLRSALRRPNGPVLVAPEGTTLRAPVAELVELGGGAEIVNVMVDGVDDDGAAGLEGIWPWQPWRLRHGQHLGRVLVVDASLLAAATRWVGDGDLAESPHLAVQLFAAAHGLRGGHVSRPMATATDWTIASDQVLTEAERSACARLLAAPAPTG